MDQPIDELEAIEFMIDTNIHRYSRKQIACMLRPKFKVERAKEWLSKCLNPKGDQHFRPKDVRDICRITGRGDIYLNFFADDLGFERTIKKVVLDPAKEVVVLRQALMDLGKDPDKVTKECLQEHKGLLVLALKKDREDK
jgi:hypothetical protein